MLKEWVKFNIAWLKLKKRRGGLTISDILYAALAIVLASALMPVVRDSVETAKANASTMEILVWSMIPWLIPFFIIMTLAQKARAPKAYEYEE